MSGCGCTTLTRPYQAQPKTYMFRYIFFALPSRCVPTADTTCTVFFEIYTCFNILILIASLYRLYHLYNCVEQLIAPLPYRTSCVVCRMPYARCVTRAIAAASFVRAASSRSVAWVYNADLAVAAANRRASSSGRFRGYNNIPTAPAKHSCST